MSRGGYHMTPRTHTDLIVASPLQALQPSPPLMQRTKYESRGDSRNHPRSRVPPCELCAIQASVTEASICGSTTVNLPDISGAVGISNLRILSSRKALHQKGRRYLMFDRCSSRSTVLSMTDGRVALLMWHRMPANEPPRLQQLTSTSNTLDEYSSNR